MNKPSDRDEYYAAARTWAEGQASATARETRIAWRIAAAASVIALLLAITLLLLVPLKTVQPYILSVDSHTGVIEPAMSVESGRLTQNEAVIKAELASYVIARESFDSTDLAQQYHRVQMLSSRPVAAAYVGEMSADNPDSPLRSLDKGDTVSIKIKSVSLINDNAALVRYTATRTAAGAGVGSSTDYVSAISFGFNGRALNQSDRFDNPLGFQVTRYRRDMEGFAS